MSRRRRFTFVKTTPTMLCAVHSGTLPRTCRHGLEDAQQSAQRNSHRGCRAIYMMEVPATTNSTDSGESFCSSPDSADFESQQPNHSRQNRSGSDRPPASAFGVTRTSQVYVQFGSPPIHPWSRPSASRTCSTIRRRLAGLISFPTPPL